MPNVTYNANNMDAENWASLVASIPLQKGARDSKTPDSQTTASAYQDKTDNQDTSNANSYVHFNAYSPLSNLSVTANIAYPINALNIDARSYIHAVADNIQVPLEMVATSFLGIISTCVQGKYYVEIKPGWNEELSLYCLSLAEPSERKSATLSVLTKPIIEYERNYNLEHKSEFARYAHNLEYLTKRYNHLQTQAIKATASDQADAYYGERISVNRIGRDDFVLENPHLTIVEAIQPAVLFTCAACKIHLVTD